MLVATTVIEVGIDVRERDRDAGRERRALRALAAAPAAGAGRPRRASLQLPSGRIPPDPPALGGCARWWSTPTASGWRRSIWSCATRASWSAPVNRGWASSRWRACPRTRRCWSARARGRRRSSRATPSCEARSTRCWARRWSDGRSATRGAGADLARVRVIAGRWGGRRLQAPKGRATPGRHPTGCGRRLLDARRRWRTRACSTCSRAPARWGSRRSRGARGGRCSSSATRPRWRR